MFTRRYRVTGLTRPRFKLKRIRLHLVGDEVLHLHEAHARRAVLIADNRRWRHSCLSGIAKEHEGIVRKII